MRVDKRGTNYNSMASILLCSVWSGFGQVVFCSNFIQTGDGKSVSEWYCSMYQIQANTYQESNTTAANFILTGIPVHIPLSKLPVNSYSRKPFSNSKMERELCVAEVEVQADMPLVVATSHLKSPGPGPLGWGQTFSRERVDQAKETLTFLKKNVNVIFCGDMNWDDDLDGQFPLLGGWVDAWVQLKPGENGWTYDTKSNKMLYGDWPVQKRLDRFVCNLRDFKLRGIDMIGMEAIPGLSYWKKGKNKVDRAPVFPSDHYGLLLTISAK